MVVSLKQRLEKVESDLLIDLDGDGIPDIKQIAEIRMNQDEVANELQSNIQAMQEGKNRATTELQTNIVAAL